MQAGVLHHHRVAPSGRAASAVASLFVDSYDSDAPRVALPRAEIQLVARFGPSARSGLDVHALGGRERVHRKLIRGGQRAITARLHLGVHEAVLGASASAMAGRIVPLEELWGTAATERLVDRLARASDAAGAALILESAIAERLAVASGSRTSARLALDAAMRLTSTNVNVVADELGVSERHLRRVFRETIGLSPKSFAKLTRFHRALHAARDGQPTNWASIAVAAGYYDQAHLIAEFRAMSGVTPRALLGELRVPL